MERAALRICIRLGIRNPSEFWDLPDSAILDWLADDHARQDDIGRLTDALVNHEPDSLLSPEAFMLAGLARLG